ncbi:GLPGLI family protein [Shivajiella indica]|uniref:GLPGLI family protein n=1 Tax=Shivajiella indica TaxID=872115 RepID=A0ABW5B5Z1_9BACT
MRKYLLAMFVCASWAFISEQFDQGVITYSTKVNMHKRIPAEQEEMKKMIPEFSTTQSQLIFNQTESLFKPVPPDENPFDQGPGNDGPRVMRMVLQNETYLNRDEDMFTQLKEFMGKKYIIKKESNRLPWKLGDETKEIQGYLCKNAFFTDESEREVMAWYTEEIRLPIGPETYHGLPGLILEVAINKDDMVIFADKIDLRALKKNELKLPKGGQEVTDEEYRAMVEEQMEKMGGQGSGGGFRMMIRN